MPRIGICKLTRERGKFVKSHIIPRAFSDKNLDRVGRIQGGQLGQRPLLRFTSWYDDEIVIRRGEDILAKYDTHAVNEIRRLGLCWRFFPPASASTSMPFGEFELLKYSDVKTHALRMFFLSMLWRAAVSSRSEFREIRLDVESLRKLRLIVLGTAKPTEADFPITLVLLRTKGQPQNLTPLRQRVAIPQIVKGLPRELKIFRFFIDGLIAHIGRKTNDWKTKGAWSPRDVGSSTDLIVLARNYEGSFQEENLNYLMEEAERDWPVELEKLYRKI